MNALATASYSTDTLKNKTKQAKNDRKTTQFLLSFIPLRDNPVGENKTYLQICANLQRKFIDALQVCCRCPLYRWAKM